MKTLLTTLCILILAGVAIAEKPVIESNGWVPARMECPLSVTTYDWNFADGDQGFTLSTCDDTGGDPIWEYGADANFPANVWATVLNGNYHSNSGEALVSPTFLVDESTSLVQVTHYFDTETNYDGCNLLVNGTPVAPMDGYTLEAISPSESYYAFCVEGQPGFSGHDLDDYVMITSCFDIAAFDGENVNLEFQLGSDTTVHYPGWYLGGVIVGGAEPVSTTDTDWDAMKALYR